MRRNQKIGIYGAAGVLALLVLIPLLLSVINWNFAKPWIAEKVSNATGRSFVINGDLDLSWQKPARTETGWRRFIPWPHLRAHELALGNPQWATTGPTMATVPQVDFGLNPLALFRKRVSITTLILTEPMLNLEVGKEGQNNWTFKKEEEQKEKSAWQLVIHDLTLNEGTVRLVDPVKKADVTTRIDTEDDGSITWKINGKLGDDKVSGFGRAGALLSLQDRDNQYPVKAELKVGKTDVKVEGTLTDPRNLSALDVQLQIEGASMGQLFPFSGIVLPETPRFSTKGRVVGSLAKDKFHLSYQDFTGKVGASDIGGTLEYLRREPRPLLRGKVVSNHLNLKDLAALVAGGKDDDGKQATDKPKQPPNKVLPVAPFRTERWDKIDTRVEFTGKEIISRAELPIENLHTNIRLDNGTLSLAPLNFGVAGGKFATELRIEGKSEPVKASFTIAARGLKLNRLFPKVESMQASLGQVHGNAKLTATGNSLAALAASANGEVKAFISEGTISKFILEAMGLNVGSVIITKLFGDRQVQLNCLASDFSVKDGLMETRAFIIDTKDAVIPINGQIDLETEKMALEIKPESKGIRIISLRSPLYVQGTFKNPEVGVDKGTIALKAGAAAVLGTVATPLAALLALVNPGPEQESPCPGLLAQAKEKPSAPPAGKKQPAASTSTK